MNEWKSIGTKAKLHEISDWERKKRKTKRKKKERQLGLIKKKEEGKKGDWKTYESYSRTE